VPVAEEGSMGEDYQMNIPINEPITISGPSTGISISYGFEFEPKDDMTPVEAARCGFLFASFVGSKGMMNARKYIEENKLERHFK
jgi:hypothetical protein